MKESQQNAAASSAAAEIDWLGVCRKASQAVERALGKLPTRREREPSLGIGSGGDETSAVDAAAEQAVVEQLEQLHADGLEFTLVSEELGERVYGRGASLLRLVVDPIDGSNNAKRTLPFYSLSIAVAEGATLGDVVFGYVHDLGTGEEWTAAEGRGARLNGRSLLGPGPREEIELMSLEATRTDLVAQVIDSLVKRARRIRVMGSLALSLCHLAAGRIDAVLSLKPVRSVDIAAAQLLVRDRGLAIELPDWDSFLKAPLDLESRSRVVAAATPGVCREISDALKASLPLERAAQP